VTLIPERSEKSVNFHQERQLVSPKHIFRTSLLFRPDRSSLSMKTSMALLSSLTVVKVPRGWRGG